MNVTTVATNALIAFIPQNPDDAVKAIYKWIKQPVEMPSLLQLLTTCLRVGYSHLYSYLFKPKVLAALLLGILWRLRDDPLIRTLLLASPYRMDNSRMRTWFRTKTVEPTTVDKPAPHAEARASRKAARSFVNSFSKRFDLEQFGFQENRPTRGIRTYHWPSDVAIPMAYSLRSSNDVVVSFDVDYYTDLAQINPTGSPALLYTAYPRDAASPFHYFRPDGFITCKEDGSNTYTHQLWNWGKESIIHQLSWHMLIPYFTLYHVEIKRVDPMHAIVALLPFAQYIGPRALLANMYWGSNLERLNPVQPAANDSPAWTVLSYMDQGTARTSIAETGTSAYVTLDSAALHEVQIFGRNYPYSTIISTIEKTCGVSHAEARIISAYVKNCAVQPVNLTGPPEYRKSDFETRVYSDDPTEDPRNPMVQNTINPVNGAVVPGHTQANTDLAMKVRVTDPATAHAKHRDFEKVRPYAEEFKVFLRKKLRGNLRPLNLSELHDTYDTPADRAKIARAEGGDLGKPGSHFLKVEVSKLKDDGTCKPRNIVSFQPADRAEQLRFAKPAAELLKKLHFYGPGRTPIEIARGVNTACKKSKQFMTNSDIGSFDGSMWETIWKEVEEILCDMFSPEYADEIKAMVRHVWTCKVYDKTGRKLDFLDTLRSGSGITSLAATLVNALISYVAKRLSGLTPRKAFSTLGLYYGDDGVTPDLAAADHAHACKLMGFSSEANEIPRGKAGVSFLSRFYGPGIFGDDLNSCCDLKRQLMKIGNSTHKGVSQETIFMEKMRGYYNSDKNSPLIGPLARKAMALGKHIVVDDQRCGYWYTKDTSQQYPNELGQWMEELAAEQGLTEHSIHFEFYVENATTLQELMAYPPLCQQHLG